MKTKHFAHVFFWIFILNNSLWSQQTHKAYNFVNIKDGISKVGASTIVQDHYGFIWICTDGTGISKYDGISYTSYKHKPNDSTSLSSSSVYCSYLDKQHRLWIGTRNGLDLYDTTLDQFKRIAINSMPENPNMISTSVESLTEDNTGNLYIGTFDGLYILHLGDFTLKRVPDADHDIGVMSVKSLKTMQGTKVYGGTNHGLRVYDPTSHRFHIAIFKTKAGFQSIEVPVQTLWIDQNNILWVGTASKGLYKIESKGYDMHEISHFPVTENRILSLISIPDGTLMCGTENDGLIHLNTDGRLIKNYMFDKADKNSIRSNSIWSLFVDKNERIWIGYYNSGVGVYDKLYDKFNDIESLASNPNSLQASSVTGIAQDASGKLWIGMDGGGLDVYDRNTNTFTHLNNKNNKLFSGFNALDIQTVFIDSKKNVWAGSWNSGLFVLKKGNKSFINYTAENMPKVFMSNRILSFAEDTDGVIWIGTFFGGLISYHPDNDMFIHHNSDTFVKNGLDYGAIRKVLVDRENIIWVGTISGLYKITRKPEGQLAVVSMETYMANDNQNTASTNHILSMYEASDGFLWIGTRGAGLCKYDPSNALFSWYDQSYGLQEENIVAITEGERGDIWVSGNSGIHKLDFNRNHTTSYSANDGLLSNDFNPNAVFKDEEGNIYFGNYKGVDYFHPNHIEVNTDVPSLHLTGFKLFNKKVLPDQEGAPLKKVISETDSIILGHKQSVFTIEYSGINYTRPEKNQYAYYLEGLETSWNYVGNARSATYTNLDHGDYTFKLKSANNDGIWNETPLTLTITILPPWWKTTWAILLYIGLFFLGTYLLTMMTKNRIKEKQTIRYERKKRIQEEALNEKKLQFFTNISHEFRTPLTLIMNPLEDIIKNEAYNISTIVKEKHQIIHKNADRLSRLINELMDFRKLESNKIRVKASQLNIIDFVRDISHYFKEEASQKKIRLAIEHEDAELKVWGDLGMLEKIIFNLLSNAFKVTPEGGKITIGISLSAPQLHRLNTNKGDDVKTFEISISDTGPGLEKVQLAHIFERFYQVDHLNKGYYGGTGIGLEVVRNFANLHGGKVVVDSEVNVGTVFRVILPLGNAHFQEDQIITEDHIKQASNKEKFILPEVTQSEVGDVVFNEESNKVNTLLIVEDNTELRHYLKTELSDQYRILTAANGVSGLKIAREETPDIIITDVIMPKMNGFDFCMYIKKEIKTSHIPLLMLTAKTMTDDQLQSIKVGADAYMSKPFDMRVLRLRISQLLTSRQLLFNKYFSAVSDTFIHENTTSLDKEFIQGVLHYIHEQLSDPNLNVALLSSRFNLSRSQFYRKIKALTGQSAHQFLRNVRLQNAKRMLETGAFTIGEVGYKVGFSSPSYFTKCFKAHFGILPTDIEVEE